MALSEADSDPVQRWIPAAMSDAELVLEFHARKVMQLVYMNMQCG
jgi:hypothetical protein